MSTKTKPKKEKKKKTREDLTPEYTLGDITLPKPVKTDEYQEKIESIQSDIDTKGPTLNEMAVNMLTEDQKELIKSYGLTTGAPSWEWGNRYEGGKFILPTGEPIALTNEDRKVMAGEGGTPSEGLLEARKIEALYHQLQGRQEESRTQITREAFEEEA